VRDLHDIWHGDSIDLCKRFQAKRMVNCIITDPPYGSNNHSNSATTVEGKKNARRILNDETPEIATRTFNGVMDSLLPATTDQCDLYVFTSYQVLDHWLAVTNDLMRHGFERSGVLVWEKDGPGQGDINGSWGMSHEFIIFLKKGGRPRSAGVKRRSGVLHYPQIRPDKLLHPHEKPAPLLQELMKFSTHRGDFLVDPFGGSGSLVRAAREIERNAVAIELDQENWEISYNALHTAATALI
jgi:adenine-specific DNA-methyltransferase